MGPSRSCWNCTTSRRRLLQIGLEFHVCTVNKSAHTKKSGNLSYAPRSNTCNHFTVCKQMIDIEYIYKCSIARMMSKNVFKSHIFDIYL